MPEGRSRVAFHGISEPHRTSETELKFHQLFVAEVRGRETPAPGERMTLIAAAQDVHLVDASGLHVSTLSD